MTGTEMVQDIMKNTSNGDIDQEDKDYKVVEAKDATEAEKHDNLDEKDLFPLQLGWFDVNQSLLYPDQDQEEDTHYQLKSSHLIGIEVNTDPLKLIQMWMSGGPRHLNKPRTLGHDAKRHAHIEEDLVDGLEEGDIRLDHETAEKPNLGHVVDDQEAKTDEAALCADARADE